MTEEQVNEFTELNEKFEEFLDEQPEVISEREALERFDEMLDDCYPEVSIGGYTYSQSIAFKRVDESAYHQEFLNYIDSLADDDILVEGYSNE